MSIGSSAQTSQTNIADLGYQALKEGDYKTALRYISFLAANGDARAQYNMGVFYRDGIEVEQNDVKALRWFLEAAEDVHQGHTWVRSEQRSRCLAEE